MLLREHFANLSSGAFLNLNHGSYNADMRRMAGDDIILTGGANGSGSATISKMLHAKDRCCHPIPDAVQRVAHDALRKLVALVVGVRAGGHRAGPSMASRTAATEVAAGGCASS